MDYQNVELGIVVNLKTLREVFKGLSIGGKRWWIASDPQNALEDGAIIIGHGDPYCKDRLNTITFRLPTLNKEVPIGGTDRIVVLLDPSTSSSEEPGYYIENGRVVLDSLEDFFCFYYPIKRALIARLQTGDYRLQENNESPSFLRLCRSRVGVLGNRSALAGDAEASICLCAIHQVPLADGDHSECPIELLACPEHRDEQLHVMGTLDTSDLPDS